MAITDRLHLIVTTPETTVLDTQADALRFPLYDGQIGVLPGRAPLVGRLGYGELLVTRGNEKLSYFIDGGFVQINGSVVSLLTDRAVPTEKLRADEATAALERSKTLPARTDEEYAVKQREQQRARQMKTMAR
jgi:F-type H+-transporting ATPase subunit epsilon